MSDIERQMMRRAVALARKGVGRTSPNPAVGCVIVRNGIIVGEGWHRQAGTPHAEVLALRQAGELARGSDLYVTLEPCAHFGKTPPCVQAVITAGIGRVFVGMVDPNPLVSGKGESQLRAAGIAVHTGLLEEECRRLNLPFIKHVTTRRPFVTMKSAMTLDGRTATAAGDAFWISSEASRRLVHRLRSESDAVMTGSGTLLADDPQLTVRLAKGKNPIRVVVDSRLKMPPAARVLADIVTAPLIIATISNDSGRIAKLQERGIEVLICRTKDGAVDLADLLAKLGERGVQSILLEAGERLCGAMQRQGLIDRYLIFIAPKFIGGSGKGLFAGAGARLMQESAPLTISKVVRVGGDLLVEAFPEESCLQG